MDDYSITLPVSEIFASTSGVMIVEKNSKLVYRQNLESFALYFKKEFKYDFIQYEANEHLYEDNKYNGFLFSEQAWDRLEEGKPMPYRLVGGGCFRPRESTNREPLWILDWIWLHPFFRHRGHLSTHWQYFRQQYGEFIIEQPYSADMEKFLAKNT